jgi:hypothetical protein
VFCSGDQAEILARHPESAPPLPIPAVLDSYVVVLLHHRLHEKRSRPVVLDASGPKRVCPVGALLLAATMRSRTDRGAPPRIVRMSYPVRRPLDRHPLAEWLHED